MDASRDRAAPDDRVVIRADIEAARGRIVTTLEALRHKIDVPARLGDAVGLAAGDFIAHMIDRATPAKNAEEEEEEAAQGTWTQIHGSPNRSAGDSSGSGRAPPPS
jgi:hypothetical protein